MVKTPLKILLVEDNDQDAFLVEEYLKMEKKINFTLKHVEQLQDGIKCIIEQSFDIILLDLKLPDAEGLEVVERMHAAALDIPIVVLTGFDDESLGIKAVQSGAQDYLVKGKFDSASLIRAIRYAIEREENKRKDLLW